VVTTQPSHATIGSESRSWAIPAPSDLPWMAALVAADVAFSVLAAGCVLAGWTSAWARQAGWRDELVYAATYHVPMLASIAAVALGWRASVRFPRVDTSTGRVSPPASGRTHHPANQSSRTAPASPCAAARIIAAFPIGEETALQAWPAEPAERRHIWGCAASVTASCAVWLIPALLTTLRVPTMGASLVVISGARLLRCLDAAGAGAWLGETCIVSPAGLRLDRAWRATTVPWAHALVVLTTAVGTPLNHAWVFDGRTWRQRVLFASAARLLAAYSSLHAKRTRDDPERRSWPAAPLPPGQQVAGGRRSCSGSPGA